MFKVTYFNVLDGKRHTLVDRLDEELAVAVFKSFNDKSDPSMYMPGLAIEEEN